MRSGICTKSLKLLGAGEGNGTLVFSLEGVLRFGTCTGKQRGSLEPPFEGPDRADTSFHVNAQALVFKTTLPWTRPTNPASLPRGPSTLDQIPQQICRYCQLCKRGAASSDLLDRTADAYRFGMGCEPVLGGLLAGLAV